MAGTVIDASALLAHLHDEPGAATVARALGEGATISAVNLAEVLSPLASRGADPRRVARELSRRGLVGGALGVEPFTGEDAIEVARLRP